MACAVVTAGFFVGVFLDGTAVSGTGIFFGVASSLITATHSVVIKRSLAAVQGSALKLSWYNNLLSAVVLAPLVILAGEGPAVGDLLLGVDTTGKLTTFVWGSIITVCNSRVVLC
jgi:solute carrier family 35 (GDP-fucose transporter), member C1